MDEPFHKERMHRGASLQSALLHEESGEGVDEAAEETFQGFLHAVFAEKEMTQYTQGATLHAVGIFA